jgi:5-methylcytosine-specific restriction endonuclease McrA
VKHYGGRCLCCGRNDVTLTVDHIVPLVMGGSNDISNIQPLCRSCNCSKQAKNIDYRPDKGIKRWIQRKLFE